MTMDTYIPAGTVLLPLPHAPYNYGPMIVVHDQTATGFRDPDGAGEWREVRAIGHRNTEKVGVFDLLHNLRYFTVTSSVVPNAEHLDDVPTMPRAEFEALLRTASPELAPG